MTPIVGTVLGHRCVFQQMLTMIYDSHFFHVLWHSYNSFVLRACKSHFTHPQCQGKAIVSTDQREQGLELLQEQHTGVWSRGWGSHSSAKAHLTKEALSFSVIPSLISHPKLSSRWMTDLQHMSVFPFSGRDHAQGQGMNPNLSAVQGLSTWQTFFFLQ